jgi:AcrR family transcriptional regulator
VNLLKQPNRIIEEVSDKVVPDKREKILSAAERLFCQHGFDGVSTRSLAKEAGVNIAMLSYYFGSKEKLYESTIQHLIEKKRDNIHNLLKGLNSPIDKVYAIVDFYVDKVFIQGEAYKIFMREVSISQSSKISGDILKFFMQNVDTMKSLFLEGFSMGVFRKVDVEMTIMTLMASVNHLTYNPALYAKVFNLDENNPISSNENLKKRLKDHLKNLLAAHLAIIKP